jgi:hypothetical protein
MFNLEDFHAYAQIKAFDVISSGNFRRHLGMSRESGERWAVLMYNRQNKVVIKLREVVSLVAQLSTPQSQIVQKICRDVMSCAQPPIKVLTGTNLCSLTGVHAEHCIDLTRAGKNTSEVYVHPRFWHFFVFLWLCSKLEYVIRACTKQWLDVHEIKPTPTRYTSICEDYIMQNAGFNERLYLLLERALEYTTLSLSLYRDKFALQPVLTAPVDFLHETEDCTCLSPIQTKNSANACR